MNNPTSSQLDTIRNWLQSGSINLFGLPYAGKDMQGRQLADFFNAPLLGGGDILRNSIIPEHVKTLVNSGKLAPIEDYLKIVLPYLSKDEFKGRPLILSSVGRWHGEEEGVIQATASSGHPLKAVIYLNIDEETVRRRWQAAQDKKDREARIDDAEHLLDVRLGEFQQKTLSVIETYRQQGLLIEIDAQLSKEEVTEHIIEELFKRATT